MNNTKRKHVGTAGVILLLSLVAPATAFASSGEEITQGEVIEPKPEIVEEANIDVENANIDAVLIDGPLGPGYEVIDEVQDSLGPLGPANVEIVGEQEAPSTENATYIPYTAEDVRVLARAAYFEMEMAISRGDAEYIFKMTMSVILNRVTAPDFHNTVSSVVFSGGYAKRTQRLVNSDTVIPDVLYVWAEDLLKNGPSVPTNVIYQAGFRQGHGVYDRVMGDYFCVR